MEIAKATDLQPDNLVLCLRILPEVELPETVMEKIPLDSGIDIASGPISIVGGDDFVEFGRLHDEPPIYLMF
jgi:hypothetical protein